MKRAFTLVEILVSVVLLGLISIFVSSLVQQTKSNNTIFEKKVHEDSKLEVLVDILYRDLYLSRELRIESYPQYSILHVKSKNSIYSIAEPYVTWLVLKNDNTLMRLESAKKITLPLDDEFKKDIFVDIGIKNCEHFSINVSNDKKNILTFIHIKNKKPILFEIEKL